MHYFGAHTVDNGGIHMAARRAGNSGMTALQIFTAIPKSTATKSVRPERVERFTAALAEPESTSARDRARRTCSARPPRRGEVGARERGLTKELERSTALGLGALCFHPGTASDGDRDAAANAWRRRSRSR